MKVTGTGRIQDLKIQNHAEFKYLGVTLYNENQINIEITNRIPAGNRTSNQN